MPNNVTLSEILFLNTITTEKLDFSPNIYRN